MMKARLRFAAVTWLLALASTVALAQPTARLTGVVRDGTGGALAASGSPSAAAA
jgi:hypothetical protein